MEANKRLNISDNPRRPIVFVYSVPKVGSTSIVSSLRLFGVEKMDIIHVHDETMLQVLSGVTDVTVNDWILYNQQLGKQVYVINVYRQPIERKMSTFFEKIGTFHFNVQETELHKYPMALLVRRFNNIMMHIGNGDHWLHQYNIPLPSSFYVSTEPSAFIERNQVCHRGVKYITLRLQDSEHWGAILSKWLGFKIKIVNDYEGASKPIKHIYAEFKRTYQIPINMLVEIEQTPEFMYYHSADERAAYYNKWVSKSTSEFTGYTLAEYVLYQQISIDNCHLELVQTNHYLDEGCTCKMCSFKRQKIRNELLKNNVQLSTRIVHEVAKRVKTLRRNISYKRIVI